jgi:hypothetical protein
MHSARGTPVWIAVSLGFSHQFSDNGASRVSPIRLSKGTVCGAWCWIRTVVHRLSHLMMLLCVYLVRARAAFCSELIVSIELIILPLMPIILVPSGGRFPFRFHFKFLYTTMSFRFRLKFLTAVRFGFRTAMRFGFLTAIRFVFLTAVRFGFLTAVSSSSSSASTMPLGMLTGASACPYFSMPTYIRG